MEAQQHHHDDSQHDDTTNNHANKHMNSSSFDELVLRFENEERLQWQKPDEVIHYLGNLEGLTILDIGSGTGYFSFRLADAGATVICGDVDDRFLEYISAKKTKHGHRYDKISIRKLPYDSPILEKGEVDMVFTVNTYHHIENRVEYFSEVKAGLTEKGRLVVIDFFKKETPVGPPVQMKLSENEIVEELKMAGFTQFQINTELLPYQYILIAEK